MVDFKVSSIDKTRSGLRFTKRKENKDRNTAPDCRSITMLVATQELLDVSREPDIE